MDNRLLATSLVALALGLSACGNKGPLVRAPDEPPPVPVEEAAPVEETLPDLTPPEQVPATDALETPEEDLDDEAIVPPPDTGDGG